LGRCVEACTQLVEWTSTGFRVNVSRVFQLSGSSITYLIRMNLLARQGLNPAGATTLSGCIIDQ